MFFEGFQDVETECEMSCASDILAPVVFVYMTNKTQPGTTLERELNQNVSEVEYHVQ